MAPSLCENCHKRPKFGARKYCGKTCAAQAAAKPARPKQPQPKGNAGARNPGRQQAAPQATPQKALQLCIYCGQKPRFNGFDYCGKSCAALASATQTKPPAAQGVSTTKQKTSGPPTNAPPASPAKPQKAPQKKVPVPQDDSTEEEGGLEEEEEVSTDLDAYPSDPESESEDEPSAPVAPAPQTGVKKTTGGNKPNSGVPKPVPGTCAIPRCGQPCHVDKYGVKTMYCSIRHREEAVKLGLETACIMCQRYPQSTSDYFCSSACRNESMAKT